jgi:Rrf2 family protein
MIFSSTTEYALRGLSELAARGGGRTLLDDLIAGTDLPRDFLAKIFQRLTRAKLLSSAKGRGGGFALARPAHQITLMQVAQAIDGALTFDVCVVGLNPGQRCDDSLACPLHDLYKPIRQRVRDYLETTTLADLASSLRSNAAWQQRRRETPSRPPRRARSSSLAPVPGGEGRAGNAE